MMLFNRNRKKEDAHKSVGYRFGKYLWSTVFVIALTGAVVYFVGFANLFPIEYVRNTTEMKGPPPWPLTLNKKDYNAKMLSLAHYVPPSIATTTATTTENNIASTTPVRVPFATATTSVSIQGQLWPTPTSYPEGGALLPFSRIVAYYGNFYSTKMGVLGEYSENEVLAKLASTTAQWTAADPSTPVIPAIQYIAIVAQDTAGKSGLYRAQMPDKEIEKALSMANKIHGLLFLDIQIGKSTLEAELPELAKYLVLPNVHLALDPEFSMKNNYAPGTVIGTFDAKDINFAASFLADIVRRYHLPPKVLVVHRFTKAMVTNYNEIRPLPEVEIVMDMDGWGSITLLLLLNQCNSPASNSFIMLT